VSEKFALLNAAGFTPTDQSLVLPWAETHTQPLMKCWDQQPNFQSSPMRVVLSPTHRREVRRWPLDSYARLADRLVKEWGAYVMWLWGPGEEAEVDAAIKLCQEQTYKSPKTSFREMAAIVGKMLIDKRAAIQDQTTHFVG
jgi:ADP-heptose:LPS heptosyltransferase